MTTQRPQRPTTEKIPVQPPRNGIIADPKWTKSQKDLIKQLNLLSISSLTQDGLYKDSHILLHSKDDFTRAELTRRLNTKFVRGQILTGDEVQPLIPTERISWYPKSLKKYVKFKLISTLDEIGQKCCNCQESCDNGCTCRGSLIEW